MDKLKDIMILQWITKDELEKSIEDYKKEGWETLGDIYYLIINPDEDAGEYVQTIIKLLEDKL